MNNELNKYQLWRQPKNHKTALEIYIIMTLNSELKLYWDDQNVWFKKSFSQLFIHLKLIIKLKILTKTILSCEKHKRLGEDYFLYQNWTDFLLFLYSKCHLEFFAYLLLCWNLLYRSIKWNALGIAVYRAMNAAIIFSIFIERIISNIIMLIF